MAGQQRASAMRGLLLFVLGGLVGANITYFALMRADAGAQRISAPAARDRAPSAPSVGTIPGAGDAAPRATGDNAPVLATPVARLRGVLPAPASPSAPSSPPPAAAAAADVLLLPVQGVKVAQLRDTFNDARSAGRSHDAIDIMAPAGTPVLATADGRVEKLFDSKLGGLTIYQFNPDNTLAYYYAHLARYADGLAEQQVIRQGQVIGYVGSTGNASPDAPHLHFAITLLGPEKQWWKGDAVNPYPRLARASATP